MLLADMPEVAAADIDRLIAGLRPGRGPRDRPGGRGRRDAGASGALRAPLLRVARRRCSGDRGAREILAEARRVRRRGADGRAAGPDRSRHPGGLGGVAGRARRKPDATLYSRTRRAPRSGSEPTDGPKPDASPDHRSALDRRPDPPRRCCRSLAMAGPIVVRRFVSLERLRANNEVAGFKFATVGVLYAVLLAFAVVVVWEKFSQAENEVANEAGAAATLYRLWDGIGRGARRTCAARPRPTSPPSIEDGMAGDGRGPREPGGDRGAERPLCPAARRAARRTRSAPTSSARRSTSSTS